MILGGTGDASLDTVAFNVPIDLGISVEGDPEIVPRTPLTAAAYALGMRGMHAVDADDGSRVSVTSSTEGHAMKADPASLEFGMIIGKALENLDGPGSGMIEVLVSVK